MKINNKIMISVGIVISVISIVMSFIFYKSMSNMIVYTKRDSNAYKYAKRNLMHTVEISDSDIKDFTYHFEEFKYNTNANEIEITGYEGVSEELIIPETIDGKKVTAIGKDAFNENEKVKSIVISKNIKNLDKESLQDKEIKGYKNAFLEELKSDEKLKVTILSDNDKYNFDNSEIDFTYNFEDENIILTNYIGEDIFVIIPTTINGYTVTDLDFDGASIIGIYIPSTVENISSLLGSVLMNKLLLVTVLITLVSLVLFVILNLGLNKNLTETVYNVSKDIISVLYLLGIAFLMYKMRYNPFEYMLYISLSGIISIIYIFIAIILNHIKKSSLTYDKEIKEKGNFIKETLDLLEKLDKPELKKVIESIKYSDPVSIEEVRDIEIHIIDCIKNINNDNIDKISKELTQLIKDRNRIIKNKK